MTENVQHARSGTETAHRPDGEEPAGPLADDEAAPGTDSSPAGQAERHAAEAAAEKKMGQVEAVVHRSRAERVAAGKAARAAVPLDAHAEFRPAGDRQDPIALLERQATSRVPELVPIRYGRMLVSPFAFYRGAALIMASDLATTPKSGLTAQLCGDAHLSNFGVFASPERALVFDVNDFDETLPGPWEWDVKRLAASLAIAGRENGFKTKERRQIVRRTAAAYRTAIRDFAGQRNLDVWYAKMDIDAKLQELLPLLRRGQVKRTQEVLDKARTRDSLSAFEKLTTVVDGVRRIVSEPPLVVPIQDLVPEMTAEQVTREMHGLIRAYRRTLQHDRRHLLEQFRFVEMARKVVGVGSVGTRAWIVLMLGIDDDDPLFLQAKEAQPSVLEEFCGHSQYGNCGQRVVTGQHLMQAASDIFLGFEKVMGLDGVARDYYIRQLRDQKGSYPVEGAVPSGAALYGELCGWTLARAHARSGDRVAIAAYLGSSDGFDRAIAEFAETYADQNERDYAALQQAIAEGRITAQTGL